MSFNLIGYVTPKTSYGLVTLNILARVNNCALFPISSVDEEINRTTYKTSVISGLGNAQKFLGDIPSLRIDHQFNMAMSVGRGHRLGMTFFEMDRFTDVEKNSLDSLDTLIVPTRWAKQVCEDNLNIKNIEIVKLGYCPSIFRPENFKNKKCVFLSMGKWEVRKQQDQIVEAFNEAFGLSDNVELWISCYNRFLGEQFYNRKVLDYQDTTLGHKIQMLPLVPTQNDVARIMQQAFCFVAPSLAEGWNLELLEAMACGKFTIATNYSGHTEFINDKTTLLLDTTGSELAQDNKWFNTSTMANCGNWITYSKDQLIEHMRAIYKLWQGDAILNHAAIDHVKNFTWNNTARALERIIDALY